MKKLTRVEAHHLMEISRHQKKYNNDGEQIAAEMKDRNYLVFRIFDDQLLTQYVYQADEINSLVTHFNVLCVPAEKASEYADVLPDYQS